MINLLKNQKSKINKNNNKKLKTFNKLPNENHMFLKQVKKYLIKLYKEKIFLIIF